MGLYFTIRIKFIQFRLFGESIRVIMEQPSEKGAISSFQALMVSTASRVGTGNIVGISTAICSGGYGAVFWMWVIAVIGGASAFIESTLAQIYKRRDPKTGDSYGGPAYYIEAALKNRALAVLFCVCLILTYAGGFNMLCSGVEPNPDRPGAPYVQAAMQNALGSIGPIFITVAMVLFAFTTLIGNLYYVDNCLNYIMGKVPSKAFMTVYRIIATVIIFIGAGLSIGLVWDLADVLMGFMAIINLPVIIILGNTALAALKDYTRQKDEYENPVFKASSIELKDKTEYWN